MRMLSSATENESQARHLRGGAAPRAVKPAVLTREGSSAPSADTDVVIPLFCRSMLRLRTGPRGGCRGVAEAERGHR